MTFPTETCAPSISALYTTHRGWLRRWLDRRVGNSCDADDLTQDVFLRLVKRPVPLASEPAARAWLRTVAGGLYVDLVRRRKVERAWLEALAAAPMAKEPSPEERAIHLETLCEVAAMLERLPHKVATAFLLSRLHGLKYHEIAARMGVSERMVKKYMARAMVHCLRMEAELTA